MHITIEELFNAWDGFQKGKSGKRDVMLFGRHLEDNIFSLHRELCAGAYRHGPYCEFRIWDPKPRVIHKATVRDRVVHRLVSERLERMYASRFFPHSYAGQKDKGVLAGVKAAHQAMRRVSYNYRHEAWALKMDIRRFFDSVDQKILFTILQEKVQDQDFLRLIAEIVRSYYSPLGPGRGIPIGNLTSQVFANIYLSKLDYFVKYCLRVPYYFRYADDFLLLGSAPAYLERQIPLIAHFLNERLHLDIHPNKIIWRKTSQGIDWLGYVLRPHHRVVRTRTKQRMWRRLGALTRKFQHGLIGEQAVIQSAQSYLGLLSHASAHHISEELQNMVWIETGVKIIRASSILGVPGVRGAYPVEEF